MLIEPLLTDFWLLLTFPNDLDCSEAFISNAVSIYRVLIRLIPWIAFCIARLFSSSSVVIFFHLFRVTCRVIISSFLLINSASFLIISIRSSSRRWCSCWISLCCDLMTSRYFSSSWRCLLPLSMVLSIYSASTCRCLLSPSSQSVSKLTDASFNVLAIFIIMSSFSFLGNI